MSEHLTKVVWREWYSEAVVKQLEEMRTLPRHETELDIRWMLGKEIAAALAKQANRQDPEWFREGGELVIIEPRLFAGAYSVGVEYAPSFFAYKKAEDLLPDPPHLPEA